MKCWIYVLVSTTRNYIYVGLSLQPQIRIAQHQAGREATTRPYRPFNVLLVEEYPDRASARLREKYLKSGAGKEFLKQLRASLKE